ncbi:lectin subunit alpha-like [Musca vetustissima]|uniref:lectin subunit alpha-like n=1 Tax=Musca vetustissima TaxID=27455 RepID=UPI002AB65394|nr:lectin subunit alpha-like [Musca vetustissima]
MVRHLFAALSSICLVVFITEATVSDKWSKVNEFGKIFIEEEQKYNWFEAKDECAIRDMTLIVIDTPEKNASIEKVLRRRFGKCPNLWLGGNDLGLEDKFTWSSTGKPFEFSNWSNGQPDNSKNNEHCVHYDRRTDFEWNDTQCATKMGFICEENHFLRSARHDMEEKKIAIDHLFAL